eukprot:3303963-Prymnesium_polylepis.1
MAETTGDAKWKGTSSCVSCCPLRLSLRLVGPMGTEPGAWQRMIEAVTRVAGTRVVLKLHWYEDEKLATFARKPFASNCEPVIVTRVPMVRPPGHE